jgi:hypothetical protein
MLQAWLHGPADYPATEQIHNGSQKQPAFLRADVGDIGDPDLIGSYRSWVLSQVIGSNRQLMITVGCLHPVFTFSSPAQPVLAH